MTSAQIDVRLRQFLLLLTMLIFLATLGELVLQEHTGELIQWVPFVLCGLGLVAVGMFLRRPTLSTLRLLRAIMLAVAAGGFLGITEHLLENFSFEQEIRPAATFIDTVGKAIKGAAPLLAPGVLIFAALLALAATYYHPAIVARRDS